MLGIVRYQTLLTALPAQLRGLTDGFQAPLQVKLQKDGLTFFQLDGDIYTVAIENHCMAW